MIGVTLLYLAVQIVTQGILGAALAGQKTPLAEAAAVAMGASGTNADSRRFDDLDVRLRERDDARRCRACCSRSVATDFCRRTLALVHARFHTPYVAIVVQTVDRHRARRHGQLREAGDHRQRIDPARVRRVLRWRCSSCVAAEFRTERNAVPRSVRPASFRSLAIAVIAWLLTSLERRRMEGAARRGRGRDRGLRREPAVAPRGGARGGGDAGVTDPLLAFRAEFPILERTTYLVSNSLGAMPRGVPERLAEYVDQWAELGVRAWAQGLVGRCR